MLSILYHGKAPTEALCKKDGKSHCPMAEFTLINRRKNLIFLQRPLIMAEPLSANWDKCPIYQAGHGQDGQSELGAICLAMASIGSHKSTWIHKGL